MKTKYRRQIFLVFMVSLALGVATGCHHHHDHEHNHEHEHGANHSHAHDEEHNHDEHEHHHNIPANCVKFTQEQRDAVDFAVGEVKSEKFGCVIKASAQVVSSSGDEQVVVSRASGVVRFAGSDVVEGAVVKKGQRLFSIESSGLADGNMSVLYQEAESDYNVAKSEYERKRDLSERGIVSQADLEKSRAAYERTKIAYDNLKRNFSPVGSVVTAPMSGYVKNINVQNGGYVESGQAVVTISQNKDLYLRAELSPRYYTSLRYIKGANVEMPDGCVYSLEELNGSFVSYGKSTDAGNALIPVTFRVRNRESLIAGNFVRIYIITEETQEAIVIDNSGLVEEMGNMFVFVQVATDIYEKRFVSIGGSDGRRTVVTSGLNPGETVVTKGAYWVKLAQGAAALDPHAGHVH